MRGCDETEALEIEGLSENQKLNEREERGHGGILRIVAHRVT